MRENNNIFKRITLLIIGGIFFFPALETYWATVIHAHSDLRTQDMIGTIEDGSSFQLQVNYVLDCYAEEYWTKYGIKRTGTSTYYYLLPVTTDGNTNTYITLSSSTGTNKILDQICNETIDYTFKNGAEPTTSTTLDVLVKPTKFNITNYLQEWCNETEYFGKGIDCNAYVLPYTLTYVDKEIMYIKLCVGGIALLIGVIQILTFLLALRNKKVPEPEIEMPQIIIPKEDPFDYEDKPFKYETSSKQETTEQGTMAATESKTGLRLRLKDDDSK